MSVAVTSIKLDADLKDRVSSLAKARRRAPHWIMREAINEYVVREETRQRWAEEARASWEHYQQTGLHITHEEVGEWLKKLAAGERAELPQCHI